MQKRGKRREEKLESEKMKILTIRFEKNLQKNELT